MVAVSLKKKNWNLYEDHLGAAVNQHGDSVIIRNEVVPAVMAGAIRVEPRDDSSLTVSSCCKGFFFYQHGKEG